MKKALVFIADGSEEIETLTPVDYLRRAGVEVTLAAVTGCNVLSDSEEGAAYVAQCSHGVSVIADAHVMDFFDDVTGKLDESLLPDAVVVPGGMPGSTNIASCREVVELVSAMNKAGRLVCAICAAPSVVLPLTGALEGKKWTCYPGMEERAKEYASGYVSGLPFVHDSNLITGRGPGAAEEFSMEIVSALCGKEKALEIKTGSCQR